MGWNTKPVCDLCSSGGGRKPNGLNDINRIETFNHADKGPVEAYIVELLLWLSHLTNKLKIEADIGEVGSNPSSPKFANLRSSRITPAKLMVPNEGDDDLGHSDDHIENKVEGSEVTTVDIPVVDFDSGHVIEKAAGGGGIDSVEIEPVVCWLELLVCEYLLLLILL